MGAHRESALKASEAFRLSQVRVALSGRERERRETGVGESRVVQEARRDEEQR